MQERPIGNRYFDQGEDEFRSQYGCQHVEPNWQTIHKLVFVSYPDL